MNLAELSETHVYIVQRYYIDVQDENVYEDRSAVVVLHYAGKTVLWEAKKRI